MKKTQKYFIIILAFLVVFGAGIAVLKLTEKPQDNNSSSSVSADTIPLVEKKISDITKLTVEKAMGGTLVLRSSYNEENDAVTVTADGINEKVTLEKQTTQGILTYGYKLSASKNIGPQDDLDKYGLKTPAATVTAEFKDGEKFVYDIGTTNPNGGYYVKVKGREDIFVVNLTKDIFYNATDLVTLQLTDIPTTSTDGETEAAATCHKLIIGGKNYPQEIKTQMAETAEIHSSHIMTSPTRGEDYYCDDSYISSIILNVSSIKAVSAANLAPTKEELIAYGLDEPAATLDFEVSYLSGEDDSEVKESHKLYAGTVQEDGMYPLMIDDNPVVFMVNASVVNRWYQIDPFVMRSAFVVLPVITNVDTVTVSYGSEKHVFEKPRKLKDEPSSNSALIYDYTVKNTEGKELTYKTFQKYYRALLSVTLLEDTELDSVGEAVFTVKYTFYDSNEIQEVAYYEMPDNNRQYIVKLNGSVYGVVRKTDVDTLYKATTDIENDICELI